MSESDKPRYSREEVEEILRRAAERTHADDGDAITHRELVEAAHEAGIEVGAVEHAVGELAERREDERAVAAWLARRRRRFSSHLITWMIFGVGFFLMDLAAGPGWWFHWPVLGWGLAVALQASSALRDPSPEQIEKVSRKERRRRQAEERRRTRRAASDALRQRFRDAYKSRRNAEREFERAVEAGVNALLEVATRRLDRATGRDKRPLPNTDFNRYVVLKEAEHGRVTPPLVTPPPKVRVDAIDDADREELEEEHGKARSERRSRR